MNKERFERMRAELTPSDAAVNALHEKLELESGTQKKWTYKKIVPIVAAAAVFAAVSVSVFASPIQKKFSFAEAQDQQNYESFVEKAVAGDSRDGNAYAQNAREPEGGVDTDSVENNLNEENQQCELDPTYNVAGAAGEAKGGVNEGGMVQGAIPTQNELAETPEQRAQREEDKKAEIFNGEPVIDIHRVLSWDEMPIQSKYGELKIDGADYRSTGGKTGETKLTQSNIGAKLGSSTITGHDYLENKDYTIECERFEIKGMDSKIAFAVKYAGQDGYYPFLRTGFAPKTMGELVSAYDLKNTAKFGKAYREYEKDGYYIRENYTLPDASAVFGMLFTDMSLKNEMLTSNSDYEYKLGLARSIMDISISVPELGLENLSVIVTENGYMQTNIDWTANRFFIGQDKVQAFVEYVQRNGKRVEEYRKELPSYDPGGTVAVTSGPYKVDPATERTVAEDWAGAARETTTTRVVR